LTQKSRAYLAWVIVCIVWGTTYLAIRIALETIPPLLMAAFRWLAAGALMLVVFRGLARSIPGRDAWPSLAILGVLLLGLGNGGVVWAEQTISSGMTAVLVAAMPFWLVGVERLLSQSEPFDRRRVLGLVIGFAGIVILVWPQLTVDGSRGFFTGIVATQIACAGWAVGSAYSRRRRNENVLAAAALQMLFAGICLLLVGSLRGEWAALTWNWKTGGALAYLTIAGSVIGFSAYLYALKHLPVAIVSLYAYVNPVLAVLLGTMVLQEPLSPRMAVATAVVLAGMALVRRP
jgi:drug/metabolite transporter (DMT)-like permease